MKVSELANRYARAIFEVSAENTNQVNVLNELRVIREVFEKNDDLMAWTRSAGMGREQRLQITTKTFSSVKTTDEVKNLMMVLAEKNRLYLLPEIEAGFQDRIDEANGVTRGNVKSSVALDQGDRNKIEQMVEKAVGKKVILSYSVDPSIVGGLVAQVGSFTFDDSIVSHLRRMSEALKRRTH